MGGLSVGGGGERETGRKDTGIKKYKWVVQIDGDVKKSIGNAEAKKVICKTHGRELKGGTVGRNRGYWVEGGKGGKIATTVIA